MEKDLLAAIYGIAIGDALGVPVEFRTRQSLSRFPVTDMLEGSMPKGTYSDDTAMTLCTLASLQENSWQLNLHDMMSKFADWMMNGYMAVDGNTFDIGNTTMSALLCFTKNVPLDECGSTSFDECGNGSLMRIMPIVFYLQRNPQANKFDVIKRVSSLTHAHDVCAIGCYIYVMLCLAILSNKPLSKQELCTQELPKIYESLTFLVDKGCLDLYARFFTYDSFIDLPDEAIKSDGYVVNSLEAALWCFLTTEDYRTCVLKAVNLGADSDTTAAIAGGIAGLYYGLDNIPSEWIADLRNKEVITELCQ